MLTLAGRGLKEINKTATDTANAANSDASSALTKINNNTKNLINKADEGIKDISDKATQAYSNAKTNLSSIDNKYNISNNVKNIGSNINSVFDDFKSNKYVSGSANFLQSNSLVAKFAFLILIIILFIIFLKIGTILLEYIFSPSPDPILINGTIKANTYYKIPQNPALTGAIPILRSNDSDEGLVFTWSTWLFIDKINNTNSKSLGVAPGSPPPAAGSVPAMNPIPPSPSTSASAASNSSSFNPNNYDIIFKKGTLSTTNDNAMPGLYLSNTTNELLLTMNVFTNKQNPNTNVSISLPNIPVNKWLNIIIRVSNQYVLDIFINGILAKRKILPGLPKQNYEDVYVGGGNLQGLISSLRYFNYAIGMNEIQYIINAGPNLNMVGKDLTGSMPRYLSLRWFFNGGMYNPSITS